MSKHDDLMSTVTKQYYKPVEVCNSLVFLRTLVFELRKPRWDQLKGTEDAEGYGELGTASAQRARNSSLGSMSGQRLAWAFGTFLKIKHTTILL